MAAGMAMLLSLILAFAAPVPPAMQDHQRDQDQAWAARHEGRILPLKEIERRVVPTMPGAQYIGVDFDPGSGVYTFKFLRNGAVIWVDVDGRSGQVIGRMGK
ncbi:PepSY domain-containing protein [Sphingomonas bacterium]|uniref:PepSY domain-containing protein n=1 Tax=Sphingomonas bacterium TaxID=1895847 RepID=UPI0020C653A0|nr:PepSY domain-containing protein [Sphingomonas bacterium]